MKSRHGEREALLPAARQGAGKLLSPLGEAELVERCFDPLTPPVEAADAGAELEILLDRQILVEREALGHIAGPPLHLPGLGNDVEAERLSLAAVGGEKTAKHAQGRRLPRPVGAEEAGDPALVYLDREILDDPAAVERLVETADVDRDAHRRSPIGTTSTGNPGTSDRRSSGTASTMKTSLSRLSRL